MRAENLELKKSNSLPSPITATENNEEKINLKSKIAALEFELDTLRQGYMKNQAEQTTKIDGLQMKLTATEKERDNTFNNLSVQIENLKKELSNAQEKLNVAQKRILELAEKIPTISTLETIEKMNREIVELTADLEYKNKVLAEKSASVEELTKQNKDLETENQNIFIYKTQVRLTFSNLLLLPLE